MYWGGVHHKRVAGLPLLLQQAIVLWWPARSCAESILPLYVTLYSLHLSSLELIVIVMIAYLLLSSPYLHYISTYQN